MLQERVLIARERFQSGVDRLWTLRRKMRDALSAKQGHELVKRVLMCRGTPGVPSSQRVQS
ncbi:hypothetical protein PC114_g21667 [Phytophthora cactorum]|uniref:Uncharacterized protein n=1 Tax=Phytophthora cactorum TaxID=29920 RepID=A0A8T1BI48_9STRA|nr:hypothetical protein PC114_g21667 [Phytophthora cactorum]KAG2902210.1 hypothetical protein PC117_g21532 [Phytophthora cactorum]KAG2999561.1 hypothetical protein PC120_g20890 [Phytophthora cactorum]